jgi:hypothetical protein
LALLTHSLTQTRDTPLKRAKMAFETHGSLGRGRQKKVFVRAKTQKPPHRARTKSHTQHPQKSCVVPHTHTQKSTLALLTHSLTQTRDTPLKRAKMAFETHGSLQKKKKKKNSQKASPRTVQTPTKTLSLSLTVPQANDSHTPEREAKSKIALPPHTQNLMKAFSFLQNRLPACLSTKKNSGLCKKVKKKKDFQREEKKKKSGGRFPPVLLSLL